MDKQPNPVFDKLVEELDVITAKKKFERIIDISIDAKDTISKLEKVFEEFPKAEIKNEVFKKILDEEYEDVKKQMLLKGPTYLEDHFDAIKGVKEYFFGKTGADAEDKKK